MAVYLCLNGRNEVKAEHLILNTNMHSNEEFNEKTKEDSKENICRFTMEPDEPRRFAELCGEFNSHLKQIEERLGVVIKHRGNAFAVSGVKEHTQAASEILKRLFRETGKDEELTPNTVHLYLQESAVEWVAEEIDNKLVTLRTRKGPITPGDRISNCM